MHDLRTTNVAVIVVPILIFVGAAVAMGISAATVPQIEQPVKDAAKEGSNTLLLVAGLLIFGLFGLLAIGKKGSARYRWL